MVSSARRPECPSWSTWAPRPFSPAILDFIASTATVDRYHEIIEPAGWRLDSYRRNPVFQNAHNYGDIFFTLGKALSTEVRTVGGGQALCQRIQFATEVNPVARIAYGLYKGGFLNAVSVGFIPLRWEDGNSTNGTNGTDGTNGPQRRYLEQELLEVSAVAIPANPDALALGLKSGAIAKSDLQATMDLLRALVGTASPAVNPQLNQWLDLSIWDSRRSLPCRESCAGEKSVPDRLRFSSNRSIPAQ